MRQFDILEIQKNIEERRLILGKKIEVFLLKKIGAISNFLAGVLGSKYCALFGCLVIVAISILVRSARDIGHDSAACLEIAKKLLNGGKYYQDFLENNLPLFFYLDIIPHFLAKIFALNPIIFLEIISNLVGIFTLYFSAKILRRSEFYKDKTVFNLIILSFACGFFLRVFTLHFNEFGTKSTYFLACAFPYISYHLIKDFDLKKVDQILLGLLAAILFCLKPNYGILVLVFEATKLLKKKSLKAAFCLRNYVTLALLILYFLLLINHFPEYIASIPDFSALYYGDSIFALNGILKSDLFPVLVLIFLCFFWVRKFEFLQPFFLAIIATSLIIISEFIGGFDQRFAFYSLSLPFLFLIIYLIIKNNYISWRRDGFFLLLILIISQFDHSNILALTLDLCVFWWIFVLVISKKWRALLPEKKLPFDSFSSKIFLPNSLKSWCYFLSFTTATIAFALSKNTAQLAWILSATIFIALVLFEQKLHQKFFLTKEFSRLSSCCIFVVIAHFIALHLGAIFNLDDSGAFEFKSPNYLSDQMIKTVKSYTKTNEEIAIIAALISGSYPLRNYVEKENSAPFLSLIGLYAEIEKPGKKFSQISNYKKYIVSKLRQQLDDQKNKLIFIEKKTDIIDGECHIGFLEYYFQDPEFKKIFLENYVFLNRIIEVKNSKKEVEFFSDENALSQEQESLLIKNDIEVYIRKNDQ